MNKSRCIWLLAVIISMIAQNSQAGEKDLRPLFEKFGIGIYNQGARGTCSVFAVTGLLEFEYAHASDKQVVPLSVEYLNWASNQISGKPADGSFFSDAVTALNKYGISTNELFPYSAQNYISQAGPSAVAVRDAQKRCGVKAKWIKVWDPNTGMSDEQIAQVKTSIMNEHPVAIGFRWPKMDDRYRKMENGIMSVPPVEGVFDGHSVLLVGYKDDPDIAGSGYFIFKNSHGEDYGEKGYGKMPYEYVRKYANDGVDIKIGIETRPSDRITPELAKVPFGDPFIMLWEGRYFAYGTYSKDGIAVLVSDDLLTWSIPAGAPAGLALNKADVWADKMFWAPEVYHVNGKFYMFYSANEHICVATSDNPLGPFKQDIEKPMIEDEKCIDNSLFIDDDGKPYLLFDRFNDGLNIWVAELEHNLVNLKPGTMHKCINVSQAWEEVWPRVNEGAFVIRRKGVYYMTYSANSYESPFYGIGVATATNISGPWTKYANNPVLQKPGDLVGIGHSALFTDKDGKLRIVFHAHNSTSQIHPRHMYISSVSFVNKDGKEVMVIDKNYITPTLQRELPSR